MWQQFKVTDVLPATMAFAYISTIRMCAWHGSGHTEALSYSDKAFSCGKSKKSELFNPEKLETHRSTKSMRQHSSGTVLLATHFRNFL